MYKTSLKKSVLLLALALPVAAIATDLNEHLSFDYRVPDTNDVADLRTGLQVMACHSKGDPMDILIKFNEFKHGTPKLTFKVDISGADYSKSYAVFQPGSATKSAQADPDFLIPWGVTVTGQVTGMEAVNKIGDRKVEYAGAFCFDRGHSLIGLGRTEFASSGGWFPIYDNCSSKSECQTKGYDSRSPHPDYCHRAGVDYNSNDPNYFWPDPDHPNEFIKNNREADFFFKHVFFRGPAKEVGPAREATVIVPFGGSKVNKTFTANNFSYTLPVGSPNNLWLNIGGGEFLLRLNNRNISSLKLTVSDDNSSEIWEWTAAQGHSLNNVLSLVHTTGQLQMQSGSNIDGDAYAVNNFYAGNNNFYRGTLVAAASLNSAYTNFITTVPLSRPAGSQGSINLVNTDNLLFTIGGKTDTSNGVGALNLSVYGEPLKFGPLKVRNRPVSTAMQLRDSCY